MKKILVLLTVLGSIGVLKAQTNVFPASGSVGIGTSSPADKLEVVGGFIKSGNASFGNFNNISARGYANFGADNHASVIIGSNIYIDNPVGMKTNMRIAISHPSLAGAGILIPGNQQDFQGSIIFHTKEANSAIADQSFYNPRMIVNANGNIGIGTMTPQAKLAVEGNILAQQVKVKTDISVPDYVFEPDYDLKSLEEIERYVKEHKHLPEIPSAKQIQAEGLDLAEMNLLLLKKVEEMTLQLIQMNSEMKKQAGLINEQSNRIKLLENK